VNVNPEIQELKRSVGRKPFTDRMRFNNDFAKCPFHTGDGDKTLHLERKPDGAFLATCFSSCGKSFDALAFVQAFDKITFPDAVKKLKDLPAEAPSTEKPKPPKIPMTPDAWEKWGRELTQADVDRFAASRAHSHTATFETFKRLGCRAKGEQIGFAYFHTDGCYTVKVRQLSSKDFFQENSLSQLGFYNLAGVSPMEDVFVVEGEPDVATLEQFGFCAVCPTTGKQREFDKVGVEIISSAERIFLIGDQEKIGQECMDRLQSVLPQEKTFRIRFEDAKDVGELAKKLGDEFPSRLEQLRNEATTPWVVRNIPTLGALSTEPLRWLVHELFPFGGVTMLAGNMGSMKSMLALFAAGAIEAGTEFLGRKVDAPTRVLVVDRENSEGDIGSRKHRMGLPDSVVHYWGDWLPDGTPNLDDPRLAEFARSGGFIIFDSLQQWFESGMSENDPVAMTLLMRKFRRLARLGAGVLVLHHAPKYGDVKYRGTTSIPNNTEQAIGIQKTDDGGGVELREIRFRGCPKWEIDAKVTFGETYSYTVLRDETAGQAVAKKKAVKTDKAGAFKEYVQQNPDANFREISDATGILLNQVGKIAADANFEQTDDGWIPKSDWLLGRAVN
jgi:5S rRNA maturation endonuclease (ribonuclease M5)